MKIIEEIKTTAAKEFNHYIQEAKDRGKPIIGHTCSYVPEEIIHAAGAVPYRLRAVESTSTEKGDIHYSQLNCSFVRHCFNEALEGSFSFLDGMIFSNGCDHTRRMYDLWRHADITPELRYMFFTPHIIGKNALKQFNRECIHMRDLLEDELDTTITDEDLKNSILLYNEKRRLLTELYNLRKNNDVPIKGSEILSLMLLISAIPVEASIALLEELLDSIEERVVSKPGDVRIMIASGHMEDVYHLEMMEDLGAVIVTDMTTLGLRNFEGMVDTDGDPLEAIARRYLTRLSAPRMMNDTKTRMEYMKHAYSEWNADGIIVERLKFCDLWGGESVLWAKECQKNAIPVLRLERNIHDASEGQIRTRVQAFYETIRNRRESLATG